MCIDVQERLFPHISGHDRIESGIIKLVNGLSLFEVPLLLSEQYPKGLGPTILALRELCEGEALVKSSFSCADDDRILSRIRQTQRTTLIVFGVESHVCVLQSVLDFKELGFSVVVVVDCIGSRSDSDHDIAVERMRKSGAILTSCESLLFELCRTSASTEFKQLSALVKY